MNSTLIKKITTKLAAFTLAGATLLGTGIMVPINAYAADTNYNYIYDQIIKLEPTEEFPKINWKKTSKLVDNLTPVDQYAIQPNKYYILCIPDSSGPTFSFGPLGYTIMLIKTTKVYECPERFWTERTVEYIKKPSGQIGVVQPNKGWNKPLLYELTNEMLK